MEQTEVCNPDEAAEATAQWLSPSAALAQFVPPEGMYLAAGSVRHEVRARYGFRIGELGLLVKQEAGSEMLSVPQIASLPGAPAGFLGLINLRGNLVPLYELRILLGMGPRQPGAEPMVLVLGQGEQAVGVIIEGRPLALSTLRQLHNLPPLPGALQDHVPAGYMQDDMVWLEFDHSTFFDEACRGIRMTTGR